MSAAAKKKTPSGGGNPFSGAADFLGGPGRWLVLPVVALAVTAGLLMLLWRQVRDDVLNEPQYQVTYDKIQLPPTPGWIRRDIKEQALRDASLDQPLSLLDPELSARISHALAMHPWVEKVNRVIPKFPAGVEVDLIYRRPVCMVELPAGYYPLDHAAILLPTADFTSSEPKKYPQLTGINSPPMGPVGSRWDDPRVTGAATIAGTLIDDWERWKLRAIVPSAQPNGGKNHDEYTYQLVTLGGTEINWGHALFREVAPEPKAEQKIARLRQYFAENGSLDPKSSEKPLDLRTNVVPIETPRTAAKP